MKVTPQKIEVLFKEYNKKYFNNQLPLCTFKTHSSFKKLGFFSCYQDTKDKKHFYGISISLTNSYDFEDDEVKHILLHEMIHLYLVHVKHAVDGNVDHGYLFIKTMRELNKKYKLDIKTQYTHIMKRAEGASRLLWWWYNKVVG